MHEIVLEGCRATPLAGYLKGLAVLRLVAEQADSAVHGCWRGDVFHLRSNLSEQALLEFFMERYAPTPMVAPWNGGSGFYRGDASLGIDAIDGSTDEGFTAYRSVISQIRQWPEMPCAFERVEDAVVTLEQATADLAPGKKRAGWERLLRAEVIARQAAAAELDDMAVPSITMDDLEKASAKLKGSQKKAASNWWKAVKKVRTEYLRSWREVHKATVLNACRARLAEECVSWLDAAYAIRVDETASYNPLLGTGANEGRLDFTNNFMQRIAELLITGDPDQSRQLLEGSLFSVAVSGLTKASIGQFDPGRAGGYNQGTEVETKDFKINPWDFVLMLEGAAVLAGSLCKRSGGDIRGYGAIPFTVNFSGVGFTSSEHTESGRAESWLPLWNNPTGYREVRHLFAEGRCSIGRRDARSGLDFTRAVGSLGVDRGIDQFIRYVFVERRGTNYVALPTGRLPVRYEPGLRLLDDLDSILGRIDGFLREFRNIPSALASARRRIDEAMYEVCVSPDHEQFADLVRTLGRMELLIAQRDRSKKPILNSPLHGLRPEWVVQCDDGEPEVRIAAALASIRSTGKVGPIRANMAGVDAAKPRAWATGRGQQKWYGNSLVDRLAGVLSQRMMDADRLSAPATPIEAMLEISPRDVVPFLYGETDDQRLEELLWGFTLVDSREEGLGALRHRWCEGLSTGPLPRGWCLLKLLHQPHHILGEQVRREPRIPQLLTAGRAEEAVAVACRRLRSQGLEPFPITDEDWIEPQRQLAALLIPTSDQRMLERLVLNENKETNLKKEMV